VTFRYHAEAECYRRAYPGALDPARVHIIPNGFEGPIGEFDVPKGERCTIVHTGTMDSYRYDTLLEALGALHQSDPLSAGQLRIVFVGEALDGLSRQAATLGLHHLVRIAGPVTHEGAANLQRDAHALLILGRPSSMKGHELFAGAKLFGYLKAGRPILGVLPADETRRILRHVGVPTIADADSVPEIVATLKRMLSAWSTDSLAALVPDRQACLAYSAERQTAALARALDGRTAEDPFTPGVVDIPPSLRRDLDERRAWTGGGVRGGGDRVLLHSR
jgi:glycosyltransferase involved in cell wall biosynthesis